MTDQAALITGSSRGIGRAAALALARSSFNIAINASKPSEQLRQTSAAIAALGVKVTECIFDVANIEEHAACLSKIEAEIGPLTTLVNNAGVSVLERGDLLNVSPESYDRCMAINARGLFFLSQAFAKRLLTRQRNPDLLYSIINVTSANATAVAITRGEYCASKSAAAMISKAFAARLGKEGIVVYDLQPGLIATDMTASVIASYRQRASDGLTLLPDVGQAEEIGKSIATLASGGLPYTTGLVISADGGMLVPRF